MKRNIRTMTDEEVVEIATLALDDVIAFDIIQSIIGHQRPDYKFKIDRELYDKKNDLMVIRAEIDGMPGCKCAIWEEDFNVDTYQDGDVIETSHQVSIFRKLEKMGFI